MEKTNATEREHLTLRRLTTTAADLAAVQQVLEGCPSYYLLEQGQLAAPGAALALMNECPPDRSTSDKAFWGIYVRNEIAGYAEILRGYPNETTMYLGLLILMESYQHRGVGALAYTRIEEEVTSWEGAATIRLAVLSTNPAPGTFWERMGFHSTGEIRPYTHNVVKTTCHMYEKAVRPAPK